MKRLVGRVVRDSDVESAYADLVGRRGAGRPYVVVNMVCSADGAISVDGQTKALSSEADRFVFHYVRSLADVILVGAQTVRAEHYGPPRISEERQAERVARGQAPVPRIAIVSGSLELDWSSRLFRETPTRPIVLTVESADTSAAAEVADVVLAGQRRVDLGAALASLGETGTGLVLCEGGPTLNGVLAVHDLIDELCITIAPALVGGDVGTGILGHARLDDLLPMSLVHTLEEGGDLFLRYRRTADDRPPAEGRVRAARTPAPDGTPVDAFYAAVGAVDYPMLIVTAGNGRERSGCLVGFASQCSIDPPRYTIWLSKKNHTYGVACAADVLTVHFPSEEQRALAELFGTETGDRIDKLAQARWHEGPLGAVVLDDVARWFVGRISETLDTGDHVAFVLEPLAGEAGPWGNQLGFQSVKDLDAGHPA